MVQIIKSLSVSNIKTKIKTVLLGYSRSKAPLNGPTIAFLRIAITGLFPA